MTVQKDERFRSALVFAMNAHAGMIRKHRDIPYILHPMEVASIAATMTEDRDVLIAALLHDTIEDAGIRPEEIADLYGERVAHFVLLETEEKYDDLPPSVTWKKRKTESISLLESTSEPEVKMLWIADKLSNVRSFYHDFLKVGSRLWEYFDEKDPKEQEWYYRTVLGLTSELKETEAWKELNDLVDRIFEAES
ncbi:MAG: bifunctional (p)ppGpp synthetase/guanosine-3',5'-bis(diphosphate) 3'-pyrophosphohydrolase [Lachnospiraceae bacterium]|nr:bifunctional (p)ppGpp synthetase/guanosine-3',5'-bis(diphosphate) 3'-pyrophosphohydrolase [Lachnospiraceae bacterium]